MAKTILGLVILSMAVASEAASTFRCGELWLLSYSQRRQRLDETLAHPRRSGAEALAVFAAFLPPSERQIAEDWMPQFKGYPATLNLAPGAQRLRVQSGEGRSGLWLQMEIFTAAERAASLSFNEGFASLPTEFFIEKDKDGYRLELWMDTSHRRFFAAHKAEIFFTLRGEPAGMALARFHRSGPKEAETQIVKGLGFLYWD